MNPVSKFIHAMEAAVDAGIDAGDMVAVVGELFPRRELRGLAHNSFTFDHELGAVGMLHPLASQQSDGAIGGIVDGDEVDKGMGFIRRKTGTAMVVAELVEAGGEAGQFAGAGHGKKESREVEFSKRQVALVSRLLPGAGANRNRG